MSFILKNLLGGRRLNICLRPPIPPPPPPVTHCMNTYLCTVHSHREGGRGVRWTSEKVRGAQVHKRGRKYQHQRQSINSIKHQKRRQLGLCCRDTILPCLPSRRTCHAGEWVGSLPSCAPFEFCPPVPRSVTLLHKWHSVASSWKDFWTSVGDPLHFGADPDPRIHTSD